MKNISCLSASYYSKNLFGLLFLFLSLSFSSCEKGEPGPAGPVGPSGSNGSSNVQSVTFTTTNASWIFDGTDNSYNASFSIPSITSEVVSNGTVQLFLGNGSSSQWIALPFSYNIAQFNYSYSLGAVQITATLSNGAIPNNPGGLQFRVVVIPPALKIANIDYNSYSDLKTFYNLSE